MEPPETYWLQSGARTVRQINRQSARRIRRLRDRLRHARRQSLGSPGRNYRRERRQSVFQRRRRQDHLARELPVAQQPWLLERSSCPQAAKIVGRLTHSLPLIRPLACPSVSLASPPLRSVKRRSKISWRLAQTPYSSGSPQRLTLQWQHEDWFRSN